MSRQFSHEVSAPDGTLDVAKPVRRVHLLRGIRDAEAERLLAA
jgi:hypothetical protein